MELEETFNITFSTDEIAVMDCLSNIIDITKERCRKLKHNLVADGYSYRIRPITYEDAQFIIDVRLEDKNEITLFMKYLLMLIYNINGWINILNEMMITISL